MAEILLDRVEAEHYEPVIDGDEAAAVPAARSGGLSAAQGVAGAVAGLQ